MNQKEVKTAQLKIQGMTCHSCEIMLERNLKKVSGILDVRVNHKTGEADIKADAENLPSAQAIEEVIVKAGYKLGGEGATQQGQQASSQEGVLKVGIDGMADRTCERLIRHKLKLVPNVKYASVHAEKGSANIYYKEKAPLWEDLKAAVESAGFRLRQLDKPSSTKETPRQKWIEIGACLIIIFALYKILTVFNIISFVSSTAGATTFGGILLIGLVAGTSSCLAVTGGLLLSVAAKYNETHLTETRWGKFKPLLYFNSGRLISYFIFGGLIGLLGQSITLSPRMTGYMNIIVAVVMVSLALSLLKIIPKGSFPIRPPKRLSHWIANLSESKHPAAPLSLGALTFFLPCGFTQSLQLVALASGSFFAGAMTMFVFALGTLPTLLGISTISATAKGKASHLFLRFAGALVLVLGMFNLNSGLLLTGIDVPSALADFIPSSEIPVAAGEDPNVTETEDGSQVINMNVRAYGYSPDSFTIAAGKPTVVKVTADSNIGGCTSVVTVPEFGLTQFLKPNEENELGPFTPTQDFIITCSMGMVSAKVNVVGSNLTTTSSISIKESTTTNVEIPSDAQIVDLIWKRGGYSPNVLVVEEGKPTVVRVSAEISTGGCMSTIVFPQFNESAFVPEPGSGSALIALSTENADPGDYPITCGMGIKMATLRVKSS